MKSLNPSASRDRPRRNGVIGLGLVPGYGHPQTLSIKVSRGLNRYEAALPSTSTFGYLKSVIAQAIGLKPEKIKLVFRGIEREDHEDLQSAGIVDNSEVLVTEDTACEQNFPEEVPQACVPSKGEAAVGEIRKEVDKLEQQVVSLKDVDSGTTVDDKKIVYLTEMLMRQLLKLDGIEAEGEGKVQRKMEVRRVQNIVDSLDILKSRNPDVDNAHRNVTSGTTHCEASDPGCENERSTTMSSTAQTTGTGYPVCDGVIAMPPSAPSPVPYYYGPSNVAYPSPVPYHPPYDSYWMPYQESAAYSMPYNAHAPMPYNAHAPMPYYDPSCVFPYSTGPPSSSKNWERFG